MMNFRANYRSIIFFDLDGTLMVNPFESAVWPVVLGEIADKSGQSVETVYSLIEAENDARQNANTVAAVLAMDWDDIARTVAERLGVRLESSCEALVRQHAASHSSTLENAHEVLSELSTPERALVVATKGMTKYQQPVLDALNLTDHFTAVLTPDTHNGLKKHRHFFGDWPERGMLAIMVGDRYDDDILYPTLHGFKTVWKLPQTAIASQVVAEDPLVRAHHYPYSDKQVAHADAIVLSLTELPDVVRRLEQQFT
ncbi:MAG: HAD family hydrolase [Anaerolineae bacterium]